MTTTITNKLDRINGFLQEEGLEVSFQENFKNNGVRQGIMIRSKSSSCAPVYYLDDEFWNASDEDLAEQLKELFSRQTLTASPDNFLDKDFILGNVLPRTYAESNRKYLEEYGIFSIPLLDMAAAFFVPLEIIREGAASLTMTDQLMEQMRIDREEIISAAKDNAVRECVIMPINDALKKMGMGIPDDPEQPAVYVLTNRHGINGAGLMLSEGVLQKVSGLLGKRFVILPSSIHECLCLPCSSDDDLRCLKELVQEVNETVVMPEDKLTDSVYVWDGSLQQFSE